jgi:hypothetical protein
MPPTPSQRIWQGRFEAVIGLAAPAFDLLLTAGDRASRLLLRGDADYYPIRPAEQAFELDDARKRRAPVD